MAFKNVRRIIAGYIATAATGVRWVISSLIETDTINKTSDALIQGFTGAPEETFPALLRARYLNNTASSRRSMSLVLQGPDDATGSKSLGPSLSLTSVLQGPNAGSTVALLDADILTLQAAQAAGITVGTTLDVTAPGGVTINATDAIKGIASGTVVVSFVATSVGSATVTHGLGGTPKAVIVSCRNTFSYFATSGAIGAATFAAQVRSYTTTAATGSITVDWFAIL